jgi:hypothetical protein
MSIHDKLKERLSDALVDLEILAGDRVGPSDASWHDVAGTASCNLRALASCLDSLRAGETHHHGVPWRGLTIFPSPREVLEEGS